MSKSEILSARSCYNYYPAVLHHNDGMGWIIEYYILNPVAECFERKRMRLNSLRKRYRTTAEFRTAANEVVCTINTKLAGGWSPFGESANTRLYEKMDDVLDRYIKEKERELKPDTLRSYKSFCNIFKKWLQETLPGCRCSLFTKVHAVQYMDWYYDEHSSHPRTFNNHLKLANAFFSWAVEKCYTKESPFAHIRPKKQVEKRRTLVPSDYRAQVKQYFMENRPEMVMVSELVYFSFIRPKEITRIKVNMLRLSELRIELPGTITKNGHMRSAPLSKELCYMLAEHVKTARPDDYLFGDYWSPSDKPSTTKMFWFHWDKMRKAINLPETMQLYSLRDTGFFDKIKSGIDPLTVMQAADHHDLAMTTRYANHYDPNMVRIISEDSPDF